MKFSELLFLIQLKSPFTVKGVNLKSFQFSYGGRKFSVEYTHDLRTHEPTFFNANVAHANKDLEFAICQSRLEELLDLKVTE